MAEPTFDSTDVTFDDSTITMDQDEETAEIGSADDITTRVMALLPNGWFKP